MIQRLKNKRKKMKRRSYQNLTKRGNIFSKAIATLWEQSDRPSSIHLFPRKKVSKCYLPHQVWTVFLTLFLGSESFGLSSQPTKLHASLREWCIKFYLICLVGLCTAAADSLFSPCLHHSFRIYLFSGLNFDQYINHIFFEKKGTILMSYIYI